MKFYQLYFRDGATGTGEKLFDSTEDANDFVLRLQAEERRSARTYGDARPRRVKTRIVEVTV